MTFYTHFAEYIQRKMPHETDLVHAFNVIAIEGEQQQKVFELEIKRPLNQQIFQQKLTIDRFKAYNTALENQNKYLKKVIEDQKAKELRLRNEIREIESHSKRITLSLRETVLKKSAHLKKLKLLHGCNTPTSNTQTRNLKKPKIKRQRQRYFQQSENDGDESTGN